eukprot:Gb_12785 [translate_table: standard]
MQQKLLQTKAPNIAEVESGSNQRIFRLPDPLLTPCPPFHITQNDQVDIVSLDWRGWDFVESDILKHDNPTVAEGACQATPQESGKLLKFETFNCFSNIKELPCSSEKRSLEPLKQHHNFLENSECPSGLDVKRKLIERLFAYLKGRANITTPTELPDRMKESCKKLSCKDFEERFLSYHFRRCSERACSGPITMNLLWPDKYQPESSEEVCGNTNSVEFLNDWLHSWHERVFDTEKDRAKEHNSSRDEDWGCFQDDSETLSKDGEDGLKNVLLLTGPVGCGKSAALYACAKEQGFDVIEVNASECRNGALVKQKFGEAMESHGLNQRSVEDIAGVQDKIVLEHSFSAKETRQKKNVPNKVKKEKDCAVVSSAAKYQIFPEREKQINGLDERPAWSQSRSKALILFEDVDIIFDEDRGFMGALLQLAETAKRPIILTSNRRDPNLPRLLDRLTVEFDLPSVEELLSHAFMVCVAEGVTISPSLVEHAVKCCCRDLRKTMMLLQFWCQGRNNSKEGRQLSPRYGSIVFELDAEHRVMPKMMPWGFPCKLSETINLEISKALDEAKQQEWLHVANQAEDNATRDRILAEIKNKNQKKLNEGERKSVILKRTFSADDSIQTFTTLACEVDQTSKVTQSSTLSLDQRVKRRRLAVVTSDSEDIPAVSETELQDADEEVSVESSSDSDEMAFPALDIPQSSLNWRDAREGSESNASVFKRLKRIQEVDFSEMNSLNNASCVPESPLVPETVSDGDALSQLESGNIGNASRCMERFLSNTCRPIGNTLELQNLNCGDKRQSAIPNLEDNGLSGPCFMTKSTNHCEIGADIVVGNEDFTASQTDGTSFDGGLLAPSEYEKVTDDIKSDLACCRGNEDMESLVKHSESNTLEGVPCDKSMETVYETLPLMDECSRADFASGFIESHQNSNLPTGNPVQETWKKMVNRRENLKSLLSSGCKDALSTIESAAKLTDLISSSDILLSSCEVDYSNACKASHGSRNFYLYGDLLPAYCSNERMEMTFTIAQIGLWDCAKRCFMMGSNLDYGSDIDLGKDMLAASTDSVAVGKLILNQRNQGMVWTEEFSEFGPSETDYYSRRQERESRLSDALVSVVPTKSFFMAKGPAFHEYTSFLGRISKLEEVRLSFATTLKRRARGFRHYLNTGPYAMSSENIYSLVQHSSFGEASGK